MFPGPQQQWTCICLKYGSGEPHEVSSSTWNRHFEQAATDDEKNRIHVAQLLGKNAHLLPSTIGDDPEAGLSNNPTPLQSNQSTWTRHKEALSALAKHGRESMDSLLSVGQCKQAKTQGSSVSEQANQFPSLSLPAVHTPSSPPPPMSPPPPKYTSPPPDCINPPPEHASPLPECAMSHPPNQSSPIPNPYDQIPNPGPHTLP
ncbi:hypothetical protein BS17DRAFT_788577 [Gyrodon lividus]|nr:hypothetical protein BS17DRAFT_788577 [Gyrodon lividus]